MSVLRLLESQSGKILIDNVDISKIGQKTLREAITIIPQDPTLFQGTLKQNMDPLKLFTDDEIITALEKAQLKKMFDRKNGI